MVTASGTTAEHNPWDTAEYPYLWHAINTATFFLSVQALVAGR